MDRRQGYGLDCKWVTRELDICGRVQDIAMKDICDLRADDENCDVL